MGILYSIIRKLGDGYTKPPVSISPPNQIDQSWDRISKRRKTAVVNYTDIFSTISRYPDSKPRGLRETHAPVRARKFGGRAGFRVNSAAKMGNCFGIPSRDSKEKDGGVKCFEFLEERKEKTEVIEIDDDADNENLGDVFDDSSSEELEIVDGSRSEWEKGYRAVSSKEGKVKIVEKDNEKVNGVEKMKEVILLDDDDDDLQVPAYKKLHYNSKRNDERLNSLAA